MAVKGKTECDHKSTSVNTCTYPGQTVHTASAAPGWRGQPCDCSRYSI